MNESIVLDALNSAFCNCEYGTAKITQFTFFIMSFAMIKAETQSAYFNGCIGGRLPVLHGLGLGFSWHKNTRLRQYIHAEELKYAMLSRIKI